MKKTLRKRIAEKYPFLRYLVIGLANMHNTNFRNTVIALATKPGVFYFEEYGNLNPDKNICIMGMDDNYITQGGLLSELRNLLVRFAMAEHFGFVPVVEFRHSLYTEDEPMNGTTNAFEYYFNQPTEISLQDAWSSKYVYISRGMDALHFENLSQDYDISEPQIKRMGELYFKYIYLNDNTREFITNQIKELNNSKNTLGVQIRGGDFNALYEGHPIPIRIEQYITQIDKLIKQNGYEKIFVATDDSGALKSLQDRYGDKICFFKDTERTDDTIGIHTKNYYKKSNRYRMGLEVLRDMFTLVSCRGLVACHSGVSIFARIVKSTEENGYDDLIILDNGICHNGRKYPQRK